MKKKISILLVIIFLVLSASIYSTNLFYVKADDTSVVYDTQMVQDYLLEEAVKVDITAKKFKYSFENEKYLDTEVKNISQYRMNGVYNDRYGKLYEGTCAIVANTQVLLKYLREIQVMYDDYTVFKDVLEKGIETGAFSENNGTLNYMNDDLMNEMLKAYGIQKTAKNVRFTKMAETVIENVEKDNPTVIHLPGHAVVGVGFCDAVVEYEITKKKYFFWGEETIEKKRLVRKMLIVNDGWRDNILSDTRFYPADKLTGLIDNAVTVVE